MNKKTIRDLSLENKAVILRVDYNVPLINRDGVMVVGNDIRIRESLETIKYLIDHHVKRIVILSHLGRPEGKVVNKYSLKPVAQRLEKLIGQPVRFFKDVNDPQTHRDIIELNSGQIIMLENLRFYPQEETNDSKFARLLAGFGDIYINEAFSNCHRTHASMVGITHYLPAVAGFCLEKEIKMITQTIQSPQSPFVVIIGGAKATTKIPILEKLFIKADYVLLGGGVANTFLKALGYNIGHSVHSPESMRLCQNLIWRASRAQTRLFLPSDVVVGRFNSGIKEGVVSIEKIPLQLQALDIGPQTQADYAHIISIAKTIIWNGPMGAIEQRAFTSGNNAILKAVAQNDQAVSIVGGGETLSAIEENDYSSKITHISTGGGAMLELIEKDTLPALEVIEGK